MPLLEKNLLLEFGLDQNIADVFIKQAEVYLNNLSADEAWQKISKELLSPHYSFKLHSYLFSLIFPDWHNHPEKALVWIPTSNEIRATHLFQLMQELGLKTVNELQQWSVKNYEMFWQKIIDLLKIQFAKLPRTICDLSHGLEAPKWLAGAQMNICASCFQAPPDKIAIIFKNNQQLENITYGELNKFTNQIANSLVAEGLKAGDAIAICMPMTMHAVAIYLGIIKMGGVAVSIPDSFSTNEIATRLRIANTKAIFTQDTVSRGAKKIPLYEKISSQDLLIILLSEGSPLTEISTKTKLLENFLVENDDFELHCTDPLNSINILFSSGTTAEPKAIPWNHTTPIKVASDAYFHQNITPDDVVAWPTNLGWMMGPWLVFATLINQATMALYADLPRERAFGEFIEAAGVTVLGVVPTLVAAWRESQCMYGLDWHKIKLFTSTGECSNAEDMLFLSSLGGYKPIIEYCGGTEIGGGYITSTLLQKNYLTVFNSKALGSDFVLLDEEGRIAREGEVAIIPPSIGLSFQLLNGEHHKIYYADMPRLPDIPLLRRHGDQAKQFSNGFYSILGRNDDTMKLGAIKVSATEIERALSGIEHVIELAAVAIKPTSGGPSQLIIFVATTFNFDKAELLREMQKRLNINLNPLFKIHDIAFLKELPKTASNKIMRRILRQEYAAI